MAPGGCAGTPGTPAKFAAVPLPEGEVRQDAGMA